MTLKMAKYLGIGSTLLALGALGCSEGSDDGTDETGGAETGGGGAETGGSDDGGASGDTGGTSNGGAAATGGGETGGSSAEEMLFDFATDAMGFTIQDYTPGDDQYTNLGEAGSETAAATTVTWVDEPGQDGEPGMLRMDIPFSGDDQFADIQVQLDGFMDWAGRILRAWVKVDSGLVDSESYCGGTILSIKTGDDWVYGGSPWKNLCAEALGEWVEVVFELDFPDYSNDGYDPSMARSVAVQISSGGANADKPAATPAVVYIDSISIE